MFSTEIRLRVGFPIRTPRSLWPFAPRPGFSQLVASFFAGECLGIPHVRFVALFLVPTIQLSSPHELLDNAIFSSSRLASTFVCSRFFFLWNSFAILSINSSAALDKYFVELWRLELQTPRMQIWCSTN